MDKWKDLELEKMKVGGNDKAKAFLDGQDDWSWDMDIRERYNTRAAALLRDKISAEARGESWSVESSSAKNYQSYSIPKHKSSSKSHSRQTGGSKPHSTSGAEWSNGNPGGGGYQDMTAEDVSRHKDSFFNRVQQENANRPDNLPPSQGGKYQGFGNSSFTPVTSPTTSAEQATEYLGSVWSSFSSMALKVGSAATSKVMEASEAVQQKVKDGTLVESLQSHVTKVVDVSKRSVQDLTSVIAQKAGFEQIGGNDNPNRFRDDSQLQDPDHDLWDKEAVMTKSKSAAAGWSSYQNSASGKGNKVEEEDESWGEWGGDGWSDPKKK